MSADILSKKGANQGAEKNPLLEMLDKKNLANNLGNLQNKEQNLQNISRINEEQRQQEEQMRKMREQVKLMGSAISESISQDRMREIESKEREKEFQRTNKEKEMSDYVTNVKTEKRAIQQEVSNLEAEVNRNEKVLESKKKDLEKQISEQKSKLKEKDDEFERILAEKERLLQQLRKKLEELKARCKEEKKKTDDLEDAEDELEAERERMMAELTRLDEEIEQEEDDDEDQDLLIQKLKDEAEELANDLQEHDDELRKILEEKHDLKSDLQDLEEKAKQLEIECLQLEAQECDLDELQQELQREMDKEKQFFQDNLNLMNDLKKVELEQEQSGKNNIELEEKINMLSDHNFAERKSRAVEKLLRELEDKFWEKRRSAQQIQRNMLRMSELLGQQDQTFSGDMKLSGMTSDQVKEYIKNLGGDALKEKLNQFESSLIELEKEKEGIRNRKKKTDALVIGKDFSEINSDLIKKCLNGLRELEKEIDNIFQKENDVLIIEKVKKQFSELEKEMGIDMTKKSKHLKETLEKRQDQFLRRVDAILSRAKHIEEEVLPSVSKIADDEDEKEILKNKIQILKEIKRMAQDLTTIEIEQNTAIKLGRIEFKKESVYESIDLFNGILEIEIEVNGIEKDLSQIEKRLKEFEQGLKQFEVELKVDFYQDSIEDAQVQNTRLRKIDTQMATLNEGIARIEEAISQAQSGNSILGDQTDIMALQEVLENLKSKKYDLDRIKKELEKDGKIIDGELKEVNIEDVSPSTLERFGNELERLKEITDDQEKQITDALSQMKKVKENALQIAFKKKADKKQECKQKLKKIIDNTDELARILSEIDSMVDLIYKDAMYLRQSDASSPSKGRTSILYGKNDMEKNLELQAQNSVIETNQNEYDTLKSEKSKLKKAIQKYQAQYEELDLEKSSLVDYEALIDKLQLELDEKSGNLKDRGRDLLEVKLKKLKEDLEGLIEKYKQKKAVYSDCKKEQKEKGFEMQRIESQLNGCKLRVNGMERELLNQQSMGFKTNKEKEEMSSRYLKEVQELKAKVESKTSEIEEQKEYLKNITQDLDFMTEKVVTLERLKQIYKQLCEMTKLAALKAELKELNEQIQAKEVQVEAFIKDLLGGSLYECERKLKEADAYMEKMSKKIIELNNGMNDFEIDVKKGLANNVRTSEDQEIAKEGKRLQDWNLTDRKELKDVEDQKNLIRKVLQKIKSQLASEAGEVSLELKKKTTKLSASQLDDMINEIDTCVKKGEGHYKDLEKLSTNLDRRKEEWNKIMFKSGAKDALVDDIERTLKENLQNLEDLEGKIQQLTKNLKGFEDVSAAMKDNPDYENRQANLQKFNDTNAEEKKKIAEIEKEKNALKELIKKQQNAKAAGLKNMSIDDLQGLVKQSEETIDSLSKTNKDADTLLKQQQKRRQKLGDAEIMENFKQRVDSLNELDNKLKEIEDNTKEIQAIIQESAKINPKGAQDGLAQFAKYGASLQQVKKEKESLQKKLIDLKEKLKNRDLFRDDPSTFVPLIEEIAALRKMIGEQEAKAVKLGQDYTFMKNKYGGVDITSKIEQFKVNAEDQRKTLESLQEDIEVLKELFDEFDGYTSDTNEENFIERLGVELRILGQKHHAAKEESEQVFDAIAVAEKSMQRRTEGDSQTISAKELEERASLISQIESQAFKTKKLVDDLSQKVGKNKKVFMQMQTKEKLRRRQQEVMELNKRLEQFENQLNEIECDMQIEANKIKIGAEGSEQLMEIFEEMFDEINQIKGEYGESRNRLIVINHDISDAKDSKQHQFEILKQNLRIKKQILNNLELVKVVRSKYSQLVNKYQANKPKQKPSYKAAKGDNVDQLLADWVNTNACPVPIKRLGGGYYMFGSKKIYAKIINGKLVIRVGGGYMSVDEFMFYYGAQELNKMIAFEAVDDNDEIDLNSALDGENNKGDLIKHGGSGDSKSIIGVQQMKKRLSPRGFSPRAASPNANAQQQQRKSRQVAASPRTGSPRNVNQTGARNTDSVRSGIGGRKSPEASFLKKQTSKAEDGSYRVEMEIKEKKFVPQ